MSAHPMDEIPVRPLKFQFDEAPDPVWSRSSPEFATFINALGIHVPYFERFLVKVMRAYRGELNDEKLLSDVQAIIGQESHHAFNFVKWTEVMKQRYPKLARLDDDAREYFEHAFENSDKRFHIGFTAGYETFTFLGGLIILHRYRELMADADPTIRALWVWHQVEEVEHGAVAFDFYQAFFKEDEWYRKWMVVFAFCHIAWETFKAYAHMVRVEGYYRSPLKAFKAWKFFARFAFDLAWSAGPVLKRGYHPRDHPICNDDQNPIAVAWREYVKSGNDALRLTDQDIDKLLAQQYL